MQYKGNQIKHVRECIAINVDTFKGKREHQWIGISCTHPVVPNLFFFRDNFIENFV